MIDDRWCLFENIRVMVFFNGGYWLIFTHSVLYYNLPEMGGLIVS